MGIWRIILIISAVWLLSEVLLAVIKRSKAELSKGRDKSSLRFLWIIIVISLVLGILTGANRLGYIAVAGGWLAYIGLALIVLGLVIRWIAIITLNRYFTVNVAIAGDQRIIQKGIYHHIRHPSYTGSLLSFYGLGLAFSSYVSFLLIAVPVTIAFLYRVKVEEEALTVAFGEDYTAYCQQSKRFLPFIY
jgi:protein-S-isoprenylcysteine O-methyltransferase Ste14